MHNLNPDQLLATTRAVRKRLDLERPVPRESLLGAFRLATFYGSVLPAVWSFMLAARARGLGTVFTTTHLEYERQVAEALNIPFDRYTQVALVPIAFFKGEDLRPAARIPLDTIVRWERW